MKKILLSMGVAAMALGAVAAQATPADDLKAFRAYFVEKFPNTEFADFRNGVYSINENFRQQWESIEEFPPYEQYVEKGEEEWNKPFANGKGYASCFGEDLTKVRSRYPHWNATKGQVVTLEGDINKCRTDNGEKKLKWKTGTMAHLSAYISYEGRGEKVNVVIPDDPKALAAYEDGKRFYYAKRGQLNLACADCHVYNSGQNLRRELLSPAIGHMTGWPVFRAKWSGKSKSGDGLGTLHRRFGGCNKQVRAKPFKAQSEQYRNLEYFLTYMSNDLEFNGPSYRK